MHQLAWLIGAWFLLFKKRLILNYLLYSLYFMRMIRTIFTLNWWLPPKTNSVYIVSRQRRLAEPQRLMYYSFYVKVIHSCVICKPPDLYSVLIKSLLLFIQNFRPDWLYRIWNVRPYPDKSITIHSSHV